ncbi:uncharacterized protein LOC128952337 [Oppia nitens]|uniref:uncharacterized protein LOC128952337 n=1 Tax=Oppia nitens TaxID=1686743 RepID=UPI0023DC5938|nr:uncharacterized protein LOC128952337 [Oppia nitens]
MNQINDNIRQSRLGRHKKQDMSVTIDVNDVFEEVVKQNERLVKEIEFYEEVVNDLIRNVKICIVCQQNDVINDRISELETHLKSKTIDNSIKVKNEYNDCDNKLKTKTLKKRCVADVTDINSNEPTDETLNYAKPIHDLKGDNKTIKTKVKTRIVRKPRTKLKRRVEDSSESDYESDEELLPELISDDKPYSLEYEIQRDLLKDKTRIIGIGCGYQCQSCVYQNTEFRALEAHVNRQHLKIKPFKCRVCCIGFYCLSDCLKHLRKKHNIVSDAIKMSNTYNKYEVIDETITEDKPYSDEYADQLRALKEVMAAINAKIVNILVRILIVLNRTSIDII